jgi:hypothetical protein
MLGCSAPRYLAPQGQNSIQGGNTASETSSFAWSPYAPVQIDDRNKKVIVDAIKVCNKETILRKNLVLTEQKAAIGLTGKASCRADLCVVRWWRSDGEGKPSRTGSCTYKRIVGNLSSGVELWDEKDTRDDWKTDIDKETGAEWSAFYILKGENRNMVLIKLGNLEIMEPTELPHR